MTIQPNQTSRPALNTPPLEAVNIVTKAIYNHKADRAREDINRVGFDSRNIVPIFKRLRTESETTQVLVVSSFVEDAFLQLLRATLVDAKTSTAQDRLFSGTGPLATFSNRVTLAYHLGWLQKITLQRLNNFRKVRNHFAHRAFTASYSDAVVIKLFTPLLDDLNGFYDEAVPAVLSKENADVSKYRPLVSLTDGERNLASLALLVGRSLAELLVMPHAQRHGVDARSLMALEGRPDPLSEILSSAVLAMFEIFETPVREDRKAEEPTQRGSACQ